MRQNSSLPTLMSLFQGVESGWALAWVVEEIVHVGLAEVVLPGVAVYRLYRRRGVEADIVWAPSNDWSW